MKVPHLKRDGAFRPQLRPLLSALRQGNNATATLYPSGGYKGCVCVTIGKPTEAAFEAAVSLSDWTRFPARIRAAATELRDQGLTGRFEIRHDDGVLEIVRLA